MFDKHTKNTELSLDICQYIYISISGISVLHGTYSMTHCLTHTLRTQNDYQVFDIIELELCQLPYVYIELYSFLLL